MSRYTIAELARQFGISHRAIRYYEDQGLIAPRREGMVRIYSQKDRTRLRLILRGKRLGFSLAEMGELFALYEADPSSRSQLISMLALIDDRSQLLSRQQRDIAQLLAELATAKQRCQEALAKLDPKDPPP